MPDLFSSIALKRSLPARRLKKQNTLNATTVITLLKTSFLAKQYTALGTLLYTHHFHDSGEIDVILSSWVLVASNRRLVIQFLAPHFTWSFLFITLPYSRGTVLTWRDDSEQVALCTYVVLPGVLSSVLSLKGFVSEKLSATFRSQRFLSFQTWKWIKSWIS